MQRAFDIVRIDHFAGIVKAYAVPYGQDKSLSGKWFKGPGRRLSMQSTKSLRVLM